jgi:hypothetical protein
MSSNAQHSAADDRRDVVDQSRSDLHRVHERIDALVMEVGKLTTAVEVSVALCDQCRPKVLGNGLRGLPERVTDLETTKRVGEWFVAKIITATGIVATICSAVATLAIHLLTKKGASP